MKTKKRILVCPLDWGLGHATRCVPIIKELIRQDCDVLIAADNYPLKFLKQEFPHLEFIRFQGYEITYPKTDNMIIYMALQTPKILKKIFKEHKELDTLISIHNIDAVISDNRYGLWTTRIPCVFLTHQIHIKALFFESVIYKINKYFISKFTMCWIPDVKEITNLSGDLSHGFKMPANANFIGILSRFRPKELDVTKKIDVLVLISGPEPQRTLFEEKVKSQLIAYCYQNPELNCLIVQGRPGEYNEQVINNIKLVSHVSSESLQKIIEISNQIICRPGYSTLMDLSVLKAKPLFVPTPGQTEQEYLADYHFQTNSIPFQTQDKLNLMHYLANPSDKELPFLKTEELLKRTISDFCKYLVLN